MHITGDYSVNSSTIAQFSKILSPEMGNFRREFNTTSTITAQFMVIYDHLVVFDQQFNTSSGIYRHNLTNFQDIRAQFEENSTPK